MSKDLVTYMQGKQQQQQLYMLLLHESVAGQCAVYTSGSFCCHVIDTTSKVLILVFINEFVLVLYILFSFIILVEIKLLQKPKNEATWV